MYIFIGSYCILLRMRKFWYIFVEKIIPHVLRLIDFSRNHVVYVIMWEIMLRQTIHSALCVLDN